MPDITNSQLCAELCSYKSQLTLSTVNCHLKILTHSTVFFRKILSGYIRVKKTNFMHCLSSVYFVSQPLHVSGVFIAHHQEVHRMDTRIGTYGSI